MNMTEALSDIQDYSSGSLIKSCIFTSQPAGEGIIECVEFGKLRTLSEQKSRRGDGRILVSQRVPFSWKKLIRVSLCSKGETI